MLWVASHAIDAIWFSTGKRLVAVTGRHGNVARPEFVTMEDHVAALFELEGVASLFMVDDFVTVIKTPDATWEKLVPEVQAVMERVLG